LSNITFKICPCCPLPVPMNVQVEPILNMSVSKLKVKIVKNYALCKFKPSPCECPTSGNTICSGNTGGNTGGTGNTGGNTGGTGGDNGNGNGNGNGN